MYKVLGLEGPYQSICSGRTDYVLDLTERFLTTLDSVYNGPELEGIKFESGVAIRFANGEYPIRKEGALLKLLSNLADE